MKSSNNILLTKDQVRSYAPSVFAQAPHEEVSSRYTFIPTIDVIEALEKSAWFPAAAQEQRVRLQSREGFQKHVIRFRQPDFGFDHVGDVCPEIVLTNAHDRSSAFHLHAGFFRLVCSNGLTVADSTFERLSVRHSGNVGDLVQAAEHTAEALPDALEEIRMMQARPVTPKEANALAEGALILRYEDLEKAPVTAKQMLTPHRYGDDKEDLWTKFNVVQENLIRGGQRYLKREQSGRLRRGRTRAIKGIDQDIRLNKALWHIAKSLSEGSELSAN